MSWPICPKCLHCQICGKSLLWHIKTPGILESFHVGPKTWKCLCDEKENN